MTPPTTVMMIAGMRDNECRQKVSAALESVAGVADVDVSLYRARATIGHEPHCEPAELVRVVENLGYGAQVAYSDSKLDSHE